MRVLLGLAALAATVNGTVTVVSSGGTGSAAQSPVSGSGAKATINVYETVGTPPTITSASGNVALNGVGIVDGGNWYFQVLNSVSTLVWVFGTNQYTAQMQYRWAPNYSPGLTFTCDTCSGGTTTSCDTTTGPGYTVSPAAGFPCAGLTRTYTMNGIQASVNGQGTFSNSLLVRFYDTEAPPVASSYSFTIIRLAPPIVGDPQIYGLQGQDFQVHGIPDEIFNLISYPNLQVNARFVYLSSGECHDNFTACFAHPGTYISEEGIRLGHDKIHVSAGSFKKGLTVSVNGQKMKNHHSTVKLGSVELLNHRRVLIKTPIMAITISNSDNFLNQETSLFDQKLLALGKQRRILVDGEQFHPEVPLHGLQGQTWRNVEYPSGLEYEGSISDYHVTDSNLFGSAFVFNQYRH